MILSCLRSVVIAVTLAPLAAWGFQPGGSGKFFPVPAHYAVPPRMAYAGGATEWHAPGYYVWHGGNLRVASYNWGYFGAGAYHPSYGEHVNYQDTYSQISLRRD